MGDATRKLNRLATDPKAEETLSLLGNDVTVRRAGTNSVMLSGAHGVFHATGRFALIAGKQAIKISVDNGLDRPAAWMATIVSSFEHHRVFAS